MRTPATAVVGRYVFGARSQKRPVRPSRASFGTRRSIANRAVSRGCRTPTGRQLSTYHSCRVGFVNSVVPISREILNRRLPTFRPQVGIAADSREPFERVRERLPVASRSAL